MKRLFKQGICIHMYIYVTIDPLHCLPTLLSLSPLFFPHLSFPFFLPLFPTTSLPPSLPPSFPPSQPDMYSRMPPHPQGYPDPLPPAMGGYPGGPGYGPAPQYPGQYPFSSQRTLPPHGMPPAGTCVYCREQKRESCNGLHSRVQLWSFALFQVWFIGTKLLDS